jgi:hypothetical protein
MHEKLAIAVTLDGGFILVQLQLRLIHWSFGS